MLSRPSAENPLVVAFCGTPLKGKSPLALPQVPKADPLTNLLSVLLQCELTAPISIAATRVSGRSTAVHFTSVGATA